MKNGKYAKRRGVASKTLALVVVMMLVIGCTIGGTIAWLTDSTEEVKNTFTTSDIDITLTETWNTDSDGNGTTDSWSAQMIPGYTYAKDPKVTVSGDSVDCYLFVKFEENNSPSTYLTYTSTLTKANGWTHGTGEDGDKIPTNVWYRKVMASDTTKYWELLQDNTISVKDTVTKTNMQAAAQAELVYTAYASQLYKSAGTEFTPAEAWENVPTT